MPVPVAVRPGGWSTVLSQETPLIASFQGDQTICQGNHSVIAKDVLGANRVIRRVPLRALEGLGYQLITSVGHCGVNSGNILCE